MKKLLHALPAAALVLGLSGCEEWNVGSDEPETAATDEVGVEQGELGTQEGVFENDEDTRQPTAGQREADTMKQGFWTDEGDPIEHPKDYIGQTITALAEVDEIMGPNFIRVEEPDWEIGDVNIFLTKGAKGATISEDDVIQLTGQVRYFNVAEVESELGWDLNRQLEIELEKKPIIIAESIEVVKADK